ncbi:hypothetical protein A6R68_20004, partial [Neotoma lepida]
TLRQAWLGRSFRLRRLGGNSAVSGLAGFLSGADWFQEEEHFNRHPDTTAQALKPHKHHEEAAVLSAGAAVYPGVKGQQVKQSPVSLVLQEGESAEIQCNFSISATQMQWFYQSSGGHLISLFSNPSGTKQNGKLKSTTVTQERRSSLYISSSQTTDSGTYFCAMNAQCSPHTCSLYTNHQLDWHGPSQSQDINRPHRTPRDVCHLLPRNLLCVLVALAFSGSSIAQKVTQVQAAINKQEGERVTMDCSYETRVNSQQGEENPLALSIQEGENVTMNCSYKTSSTVLQWYKQDSGRGPALLIIMRSNEREKHSRRLRVTLNTSTQSSSLSITDAKTADTAVYFCATDAQFAAGT